MRTPTGVSLFTLCGMNSVPPGIAVWRDTPAALQLPSD
jgi:hypothetical protein